MNLGYISFFRKVKNESFQITKQSKKKQKCIDEKNSEWKKS